MPPKILTSLLITGLALVVAPTSLWPLQPIGDPCTTLASATGETSPTTDSATVQEEMDQWEEGLTSGAGEERCDPVPEAELVSFTLPSTAAVALSVSGPAPWTTDLFDAWGGHVPLERVGSVLTWEGELPTGCYWLRIEGAGGPTRRYELRTLAIP